MVDTYPDVPPTLFHYTDAAGLKGILDPTGWPVAYALPEAEKFRYRGDSDAYFYGRATHLMASDVRYMNDSSELRFGAEIVRRHLRTAADDTTTELELREAFATVAATLDPDRLHQWPWQCFVACFCADGDLLSQWNGYAGGTGGYSIGFPTTTLAHHTNEIQLAANGMIYDMESPTKLERVQYGAVAAEAHAADLVLALIDMWNAGQLLRDLDGRPSRQVGIIAFRRIATLKHQAFAAEDEWRLIAVKSSEYPAKTRARVNGLVPYKDFIVNARTGKPTEDRADRTVTDIIVGPTTDPDTQNAQVEAVKNMMLRRDPQFPIPNVDKSSIPFRG